MRDKNRATKAALAEYLDETAIMAELEAEEARKDEEYWKEYFQRPLYSDDFDDLYDPCSDSYDYSLTDEDYWMLLGDAW